jgi:protein-S-isoprenylcysteine O-methyltransferase Ste14
MDTTRSLAPRVYSLTVGFLVALAACIFLPAWSLHYWQGVVYWLTFAGWLFFLNAYFLQHDPALVERRMKAGAGDEPRRSQKIIQSVTSVLLVGLYVVPALDYRCQWSDNVPGWLVVTADAVVCLGFFIIFRVFAVNSYTSGIVEVAAGQTVISTGPYAIVRHPMYAGVLIMVVGAPLALGSWLGLAVIAITVPVLVWRILDEEALLRDELAGYAEYARGVRYRLVPLVW